MTISVTHSQSISGAGVNIQPEPIKRSGSAAIGIQDTMAVAEAGSLSTRTSDTVGTITMSSGSHTIATADVADIFWTAAGVAGVRYGVVVGTVAGTSVPITGGAGDILPAAATDLTVVVQKDINVSIDGDEAEMVAIMLETNDKSLRTAGHVQFRDSGSSEIAEIDLVANIPKVWDIGGGSDNPFTGNPITNAKIGQGGTDSTETYTLKIVGVADASP